MHRSHVAALDHPLELALLTLDALIRAKDLTVVAAGLLRLAPIAPDILNLGLLHEFGLTGLLALEPLRTFDLADLAALDALGAFDLTGLLAFDALRALGLTLDALLLAFDTLLLAFDPLRALRLTFDTLLLAFDTLLLAFDPLRALRLAFDTLLLAFHPLRALGALGLPLDALRAFYALGLRPFFALNLDAFLVLRALGTLAAALASFRLLRFGLLRLVTTAFAALFRRSWGRQRQAGDAGDQ